MTGDDFIYKSQDVNYLGFLEAQLRDLHGIATLAYELIQNADDVPAENGRSQATWLSFDVTDDALVVENDAVFRPVDFERLQSIASGAKREEVGTTGAFGLGFIAVYQVTDAPEIFSSGRHWIIRPDAPPERRIQERQAKTEGTQFRLPWAFDEASLVRRTLRAEAIRPEQLDGFAATIGEAIELAALFLRHLKVMQVKRNGSVVTRIERLTGVDHQIVLKDNTGRTVTWLLFEADFTAEAERLRAQYSWQIEATRSHQVRLAVPVAGLDGPGRLFAGLPTDSTLPLPLHVNADFFPTTDRKRIHFDGGYQAEWNRVAIQCAARIVAHNFDTLRQQLDPTQFWHLLHKMVEAERMAAEGQLPAVFASFWQAVAPSLKIEPIVYTSTGEWQLAAEVRLVTRPTATWLLEALGIAVVHPDLAPYFGLMRRPEIGTAELTIPDIAAALNRAGLARPVPLYQAPPFLRSLEAWRELWDLVDALLGRVPRPGEKESALTALSHCALVLTDTMTLARLNRVYRGTAETKILFPDVAWIHDQLPGDTFPGRFMPNFGVRQAVDLLAEMPIDQLEAAWRRGRLDLPRLFRWFESQQIEILADDPSLRPEICRLPLVPVAGELRPLADLYMPGGFEDPLKLAGVVDLAAIGGRRQFLRDLGVAELDFDSYVHAQLPRVLAQNPDLPSDARHRLVQLLAERLGEIRDDEALQEQLAQLPLIACMDGTFRAANTVYASREVVALLGERVHVAEPVESKAVQALHRWLGVRDEPAAEDIVQALLAISHEWGDTPLDASSEATVRQRWQRLNTLLEEGQTTARALAPLQGQKVIPNRRHVLTRPDHLFLADRADLAAQFMELEDYLLAPEEELAPVMSAVGVRPLSQAVQLQIVAAAGAIPEPAVQERIANRRSLIERLLQAETTANYGALNTTFLDKLRVLKVPQLRIRYRLTAGAKSLETKPETVAVKLLSVSPEQLGVNGASVLYLSDSQEGVPWAAVARELAMGIKGDGAIGGLAIGIREVLAAETFAAAEQVLDELGYL